MKGIHCIQTPTSFFNHIVSGCSFFLEQYKFTNSFFKVAVLIHGDIKSSVLVFLFVFGIFLNTEAQWNGGTGTTSPIWRSGSVGIGTSSNPESLLTIQGDVLSNTVQTNIYNPSNIPGSVAGIRFHTASGWNVMLRTRQEKSWLELTDNDGEVQHYWDGTTYFALGKIAIGTADTPGNH